MCVYLPLFRPKTQNLSLIFYSHLAQMFSSLMYYYVTLL